jgi:hypothetical protein
MEGMGLVSDITALVRRHLLAARDVLDQLVTRLEARDIPISFVRAARQKELDAVGVLRRLPAAKADEQQGAGAPPGQRLGDGLDRGTQPVEHQGRLLVDRPAVRPFDAGRGRSRRTAAFG